MPKNPWPVTPTTVNGTLLISRLTGRIRQTAGAPLTIAHADDGDGWCADPIVSEIYQTPCGGRMPSPRKKSPETYSPAARCDSPLAITVKFPAGSYAKMLKNTDDDACCSRSNAGAGKCSRWCRPARCRSNHRWSAARTRVRLSSES